MNATSTAYWHIVLACMTRLFKIPASKARMLIRDFRQGLNSAPARFRTDLVYHVEPYELAAQLLGRESPAISKAQRAEYDEIVRRCQRDAAALGTDDEVRELQSV